MIGIYKKTAFIFPGQASQYVGMGKDLYEEFDSVREMFDKASNILGFDLAGICFEGPEDLLKQTAYTQPAVFVHSCAIDMILGENFILPDGAAGHSLGEYSALVSAGAISFEQALDAVYKRSKAMQEDCEKKPGTMAAILGMEYEKVKEVLTEIEGIVVPANCNSADQIVISGEVAAVNAACERLKSAGAKRAMMIPVGGAYHSPLMKDSSEFMKTVIHNLEFDELKFPVYCNVNAESITDSENFKMLLGEQITSPVLWYQLIQNMYRDGFRRFVEIGPGKVLQGLVKRSLSDPEMELHGIDKLDELDEYINQFSRVEVP